LVIFASAFIGATIGFLWYIHTLHRYLWAIQAALHSEDNCCICNNNQERVFDPDTLRDILVEALSVYCRLHGLKEQEKICVGRRIFLMALFITIIRKGLLRTENRHKFWIVAIILAVISIVTLKIR